MKKWMKQILAMILVFGLAFSNLLTTVAEAADDYAQEAAASDFTLTHNDSKYTISGSVTNLSLLPPEAMYLRFYDTTGARVGEVQLTTYRFEYTPTDYSMVFYGSDMVNTSNKGNANNGVIIPAGDYKVALVATQNDGTSAGSYQLNGGAVFSFNQIGVPSRDYDKPNHDETDTVTGSDITVQVSDPYFSAYTDPTTVIRNHTMTVTASSATGKNLTYQWYREGERIDGATSPSYTINEYAMYNENHNMRYYCAVSNGDDLIYSPNFRFHYQGVNEVNVQFDGDGGIFDFMHKDGTWKNGTTDEGVGAVSDSDTTIAASGYDLTDAVWADGSKTFKGWKLFTYQFMGEQNGQPIVDKVPVGDGSMMTTADVLAYKPDRDLDPLLFIAQWDDGTGGGNSGSGGNGSGSTAPTYAGAVQNAFRTSYNGNNQSGTYTIEARGNYSIDLSNSGICFTLYDYTDGSWITDLTIDPSQYSLSADGKTFTFPSDALSSDDVNISEGLYKVGISLFEQTDPVTVTRYAAGEGVHVKAITANSSGGGNTGGNVPGPFVQVMIWGEGGTFEYTVPGDSDSVSTFCTDVTEGTSLKENGVNVTAPIYWDPTRSFDKWQVLTWGTITDEDGNSWEDWVPTGNMIDHETMLAYKPTENVLFKAQWSGDDADYGSQVIYDAFGGSITVKFDENNQWETNCLEFFGWSDGTTCTSQHGFTIVGDPTAEDMTFEGWLEFHNIDGELILVSVDAAGDYVLLTTADVLGKSVPENEVVYIVKWEEISIDEYLGNTGGEGGEVGPEVNVQYQGRYRYFDFTYPGENGTGVTETVKDWGFGVPVGRSVRSAGFAATDALWPDSSRTFEGWLMYGVPSEESDRVLLNDGVPLTTEETMDLVMTDVYIAIIFEATWSGDDYNYGVDVHFDGYGGEITIQDMTGRQEKYEGVGAFVWTDDTTFSQQTDITIIGNPTADGMTFEGWLEFGLINDEWVLMSVDGDGLYEVYSTAEIIAKAVPEYDVMYVVKWAELSIDEYLGSDSGDQEYMFFFDGAGGQITVSGRNEGMLITEEYPFLDLYAEEGHTIFDYFTEGGTTEFTLIAGKEFSSFTGWNVFEAEDCEVGSVPAGTPLDVDDESVTLIYIGEYDGMDVYCAYVNMKQYKTGMTTEELLNMEPNGKHYYALAQYKETFVEVEIPNSDKDHRLEMTENDVEIPDALLGQEEGKFETKEDVKEALQEVAEEALKEIVPETGNTEESKPEVLFMEITLKVQQDDGSWEVVTEENFPDEGLEVVIPYPAGVDKDLFHFVITHLISSGSRMGEIETFGEDRYEKVDNGLKIKVFSLSPFAVVYQEIETASGDGDNSGNDGGSNSGNDGGSNGGNDGGNNGGNAGGNNGGTFLPVEGTGSGDNTSVFGLMMVMLLCAVVVVAGSKKIRRA